MAMFIIVYTTNKDHTYTYANMRTHFCMLYCADKHKMACFVFIACRVLSVCFVSAFCSSVLPCS